ncbi:MAG: hypothetical protein ACK47B_08730 [Armatimonadota bacterium]
MQDDTRRLTVAREHLQQAYEEVTLAISNTEESIAQAAMGRALNHLDMVWRRLEHQRQRVSREPLLSTVERAFVASREAWQGTHDALNDWDTARRGNLDRVRNAILQATSAVDDACAEDTTEEAQRAGASA